MAQDTDSLFVTIRQDAATSPRPQLGKQCHGILPTHLDDGFRVPCGPDDQPYVGCRQLQCPVPYKRQPGKPQGNNIKLLKQPHKTHSAVSQGYPSFDSCRGKKCSQQSLTPLLKVK